MHVTKHIHVYTYTMYLKCIYVCTYLNLFCLACIVNWYYIYYPGILAGIWPCGIFTLVDELYGAEAKCQVYGSIHSLLYSNPHETSNISGFEFSVLCYIFNNILPWTSRFLVYDDDCHLRKFATNTKRSGLTETAANIARMNIVVDKMHFKGHTDQWCKRYCNPNDYDELTGVCTSIDTMCMCI